MRKINMTAMMSMAVAMAFISFSDVTGAEAGNGERRIKGLKYDPVLHAQALAATGGWVYNESVARGTFVFVNMQKRVSPNVLVAVASMLKQKCMILVSVKELQSGTLTFSSADKLLAETGGKLAAFVIDDAALPALLVAPDSRWAIINIAPLASDSAKDEIVSNRLTKEMMRAFCMLFGVGNTMANRGPMQKISTLKDLDDILLKGLANESVSSVQRHAPNYGFSPIKRAFYRQAVQEGWAPAPTNDYQKAIWDKVHSVPKNPMKIEFDPKKGR